jgi:hypothetical protein
VAANVEEEPWSFDFNNVAIADVLRQLTLVTGIKIFTKDPPESQIVTRSYKNKTIDQILKDIFRDENYALVWNFNENELESIGIWIFDWGSSRGSETLSGEGNHVIKKNVDYNRQLPRRPLKRPAKFTKDNAPDNRELKSSNEQTDINDEEDEAGTEGKDEGSTSSPPELNEKPTTEDTDVETESTTDSPAEKKDLTTATQD